MQAIFLRDDQGVQIGSFRSNMIWMPEEMLRQAAIFLHSFDPSWKWAMTAPAWQYPCLQMLLHLWLIDFNKDDFLNSTSHMKIKIIYYIFINLTGCNQDVRVTYQRLQTRCVLIAPFYFGLQYKQLQGYKKDIIQNYESGYIKLFYHLPININSNIIFLLTPIK